MTLSVVVGNWAQYLPFFSYITCPLHLLCDQEKLALTFYQRTLELKNLLGTAATKIVNIVFERKDNQIHHLIHPIIFVF